MNAIDPNNKLKSLAQPTNNSPLVENKPSSSKSTLNLDAQPTTATPNLSGFVAAASAPPTLKGPGVAGSVLGNASPNLATWTDKQLADGIVKMANAMKADPGKVNDEDLRLLDAMTKTAGSRKIALPSTADAPDKMTNATLFQTLLAYDLAKATGQKLTKEQSDYHAKLESTFRDRAKANVDPAKELKVLAERRDELLKKAALHCGAATAQAASVGLHAHMAGYVAAGLVIAHEVHEGKYADAAAEALAVIASRHPLGWVTEAASALKNLAECKQAADELKTVNFGISYYEGQVSKGTTP